IGVLTIFLSLFWSSIKRQKEAVILLVSLFVVSLFMFAAFIYQGYGVYSIIFSTLHIVLEYWAALFIFRELKNHPNLPKTSRLFINGGLAALIISSIGPLSLGGIAANGWKEATIFDMAIYFYLHFQYNGWLYLILTGLFIFILNSTKIPFQENLLKISFWSYFIALFPGYYLSILWFPSGKVSNILATIGGIGQWIGVLCVI